MSQWISVNSDLPKHDCNLNVVMWNHTYGKMEVDIAVYDDLYKKFYEPFGMYEINPVLWSYLPEPPK